MSEIDEQDELSRRQKMLDALDDNLGSFADKEDNIFSTNAGEDTLGVNYGENIPHMGDGVSKSRANKPDTYEQLNELYRKTKRRGRITSYLLILMVLLWGGACVGGGIYAVLSQHRFLDVWFGLNVPTQTLFVIGVVMPLAVLWLVGYYVKQAQTFSYHTEHLRIQSSMLTDPSNDAIQKINQVARMLLGQLEKLGRVNNDASKKLEGVTDTLRLRTDSLQTTGMDAQSMLNSILTDMQTLGDRIENIVRQVSMQSKSFEEMMGLAEGVLNHGNEGMVGWQERFKHVTGTADQAARDLARMEDSLKTQLLSLEEASVGMTAQAERHLGSFRTETMNMLDDMVRTSHKVFDETKNLQGELSNSADHLNLTAKEMKESNAEIILAGEEKTERLLLASKEADRYLDEMEERIRDGFGSVEEQISKVTERLEGVLKILSNESSPINHELKKFLTGIEQVTQRFTTQAANLVSASNVASERYDAINAQLDDQRRDIFLKAARHLLQDMHSTSLDLTRALGEEITDQELKRFMNGEVSIFTQNLIGRNLGKLEREIVEKLETSKEARDYALRFMQQFERLLEDARQVDPERILQASFITSDIGKLYMVLCRSSGRRPNRQLTSIAGGEQQ